MRNAGASTNPLGSQERHLLVILERLCIGEQQHHLFFKKSISRTLQKKGSPFRCPSMQLQATPVGNLLSAYQK
jgi:hypothetical protein